MQFIAFENSHFDAGRPQAWLALSFSDRQAYLTIISDSAFPIPFLFRSMGFCHKEPWSLLPLYWGCQLYYVPAEDLQMAELQILTTLKSPPPFFFFARGYMDQNFFFLRSLFLSLSLSWYLLQPLNSVSPVGQPEFPTASSQPDYKSFWQTPAWWHQEFTTP